MTKVSSVLLIYPIWVSAAGRGRLQRTLPPLGILSIGGYLESLGHKVTILDLHASPMSPEKFRKYVRELQPTHVGITVLSSHFVPAHHIATICKQEAPNCRLIVGGVHAEAHPEQMLQNLSIDAVCRGDGEEVMADFASDKPFGEIAGLSFLSADKKIVHNKLGEVAKNLDQYPFPAYHLIDLKKYFPSTGSYKNYPAINALMTRGCPGQCTFCNSARTVLRGRSPERMVDLIEHLNKVHGIRQISFYDDTFTANPKSVRAFCNEMIRRKLDVSFICYARGDMFTEEFADLLARAGCHQIFLGIESGSLSLTTDIGKPIELQKYKKVVDIAHKFAIEVRGGFIIGHLEETEQTLEETLQFAKDLDLDFFLPSILTPYPGTALYKQAKAEGLLLHEDFSRYGQGEVVLKMKNLSSEKLLKFYKNSFYRFYLRPAFFWKQIKRTRTLRQVLDMLLAFKILTIDGLSKGRSQHLMEWLNFDLAAECSVALNVSGTPRLTWEVRNPNQEQQS